MNKILILGAGLSGLSSAITLAKAGYEVEVFEKADDVGKRFGGDLQGFENWTEKVDVLEDIRERNIEINFDCSPFSDFVFSNGKREEKVVFNKPIFYLVKRGSFAGSLDYGLKEQALRLGVKINFNSTIPYEKASIIASGPSGNKIIGVAKGLAFETSMKDTAVCILNNRAAYKGYSYLLVSNGYGCMCSAVVDKLNRVNDCFEETKHIFSEMMDIDIRNPKPVGGGVSFSIHNKLRNGASLITGEAAGIQDFFAGFGMRSAIISGNIAAESIIHGSDYEQAARGYFEDKKKASLVIRFLWEKGSLNNYSSILNNAKNQRNILDFVHSYTNFNTAERIMYPFVYGYMKLKSRI